MDVLDPGHQQASVNTSENNTKVRTPSCANSRAKVLGLTGDRMSYGSHLGYGRIVWVSGSFQSQIETSEEVYGVWSV